MTVRLRNASGTLAAWEQANPVLLEGEIGIESDSSPVRIKVGDGTTAWLDLAYVTTSSGSGNGLSNPLEEDLDAGGFDITNVGSVDGRSIAADGLKLDGVESGATADQSNAEVKAAYEANADTNAFTDAEQTTLGNQSGTNTGDEPDGTTTVKGIVELATDGEVAAGVVVQGNDARLSDARAPTSHGHLLADVTDSGALAAMDTITLASVTDSGALAALDTVGTAEIETAAVTTAKLGLQSVTETRIDADAVTNAKLANVATQTIKGRTTAGTGDPEDMSTDQVRAMLNTPEITVSATAPASPANNDLWFHTTHRALYYYDSTRAKWLSVDEHTIVFSKSGTIGIGAGHFLLMSGNSSASVAVGTERGFLFPWDATVTGWAWGTSANTAGWTHRLQKHDYSAGTSSYIITTAPAGNYDRFNDQALNTDWDADDLIGVSGVSGTTAIVNQQMTVTYRRRA